MCWLDAWLDNWCWRKQVLINRIPTSGGLGALLLGALLSQEAQLFPCSPPGYKPKTCPRVPHFLICSEAGHANSSPSSPEGILMGFKVIILSQQLSPSGSGVHCPQPPCRSCPGKHMLCYTASWWSPGKAHVPWEWLPCMSFREAEVCSLSIPGHSSAFQAPPTNPCLVWQVPTELISSLLTLFPQPTWLPSLLPHAAWPNILNSWLHSLWLLPTLSALMVDQLPIFQLTLILNADLELPKCPNIHPLLMGPFASSPISFTFFQLPFLVRARVPCDMPPCLSHRSCASSLQLLYHKSLYLLKVTYVFCLGR